MCCKKETITMKKMFKKKDQQQHQFKTPQKVKSNPQKQERPKTPPITPSPPTSPLAVQINAKVNYEVSKPIVHTNNQNDNKPSLVSSTPTTALSVSSSATSNNEPSTATGQDFLTKLYEKTSLLQLGDNDVNDRIMASLLGCGIDSTIPSPTKNNSAPISTSNFDHIQYVDQNLGLSTIPEERNTIWDVAALGDDSDADYDDGKELLLQNDTNALKGAWQDKNDEDKETSNGLRDDSNVKNDNKNQASTSAPNKKKKISIFTREGSGRRRLIGGKKKSNRKNKQKKNVKGKWKWAKDEKSNRIYYYHTLTREVSWDQPAEFQEWKATLDQNTNKFYYYNVITKATTWDQPSDFKLWKMVEDKDNGVYFYNVLTKETRWNKPIDESPKSLSQNESNSINKTEEKSNMNKEQKTKLKKNSATYIKAEPVLNTQIGEAIIVLQTKDTSEDECDDDEEDDILHPLPDDDDEPGRICLSPKYKLLYNLLYKYCPDEKELIQRLLSKAHGKESIIIKGIENLVAETPNDVLSMTILSFIKETLTGMGDQPYDEKLNLRTKLSSDDHVDAIAEASTSYSLNSKVMSTYSTVSYATQAVNNTTSARLSRSQPYSMKTGHSTMSSATQQINNTSNRKEEYTSLSNLGEKDMLKNNMIIENNENTDGSYGELTETDEEDLTLNKEMATNDEKVAVNDEALVLNMKSMELPQKNVPDSEAKMEKAQKIFEMTKADENTVESAYAADYDELSYIDESFDDDISALSIDSAERLRIKKEFVASKKKKRSKKPKKKVVVEREIEEEVSEVIWNITL